MTNKLTATMQIAERMYLLAEDQNDAARLLGAYRALAVTSYFLGDFEIALQYARHGIQIWHSGSVGSLVEEPLAPTVACLSYGALSEWHLGEITSYQASMAEAASMAKELNDMHALGAALFFATILSACERNPVEAERLASDVIELSTRKNFANWLPGGTVVRGWALAVSGDAAQGLSSIQNGIKDWRATGSMLLLPFWLALRAEALHLRIVPPRPLNQ